VVAAVGAAGAAVAAGLYRFTDLFVKHYPPTPYDDLLTRLVDREEAIRLGAHMPGDFDVPGQAARLRATFANRDLATVVQADIAAGRLVEVDGWVVPQSLALLSALAAKMQ
jgi:hypothetical protein